MTGFREAVSLVENLLHNEKGTIIIAIDGRCGSGKTTLGALLHEQFGGNIFHMDDFFLRPEQRTPGRLSEVGGNVDYERFREEVLLPVLSGKEAIFKRFDCTTFSLEDKACQVSPQRLNIIEGSYSLHPYFGDVYDLRLFVTVDAAAQIERIRNRNGEEKLKRFINEWIPKEEAYFQAFKIDKNAIIIQGGASER